MSDARAIQRGVRQSARKMRLVIDLIRGRAVAEAYAILRFSKKKAAVQIHKVLKSAVANAEQSAQRANKPLDVDVRNRRVRQPRLQVLADELVFLEQLGEVAARVVPRTPRLHDAETEPVRMCLLTH